MTLPRVLFLCVVLVSFGVSGPSIRYIEAPALIVVLWRLLLCWPVLCTMALLRRERWPLRQGAAAGLFLVGHWVGWVLAVQRTAMASAAILICTGPLWAALLSRPLLGEPVSRRQWLGLGLALCGIAITLGGGHGGRHTLDGDLLALGGALCWVGYSFVGRRARRQESFWSYTATVYGAAALMVLAAVLACRLPLVGLGGRSWIALAVLAFLPTLLGHGGFNYLLRFLGPARLGLFTLTEPIMATLLVWPLFGEAPGPAVAAGGLLVLAGIGLGIAERSPERL